MTTDFNENPAWELVSNFTEVGETIIEKKEEEGLLEKITKSRLVMTVEVKRNCMTALFYVITPVLAITLFNIIGFLLPTGEGLA